MVKTSIAPSPQAPSFIPPSVEIAPPKAAIETKIIEERPHTLAYEHTAHLRVPADKISAVAASIQMKCAELAPHHCELLESRLESGRTPSAFLRLRAASASIKSVLDSLGTMGTVTYLSTSAEDLAAPIADTQKKLALKQNYRARLEALLPKAAADVDSLIKINRELAEVQSEIEDSAGQSAFLAKRVNTELLHISIESPQTDSAWASLSDIPDGITRNLAYGMAAAISTVSFLTPWAVLLAALVMAIRFVRRRRRKQVGI